MKLKPRQLRFILLSVALTYKKQQKNQNTFSLDYSYISYELHRETLYRNDHQIGRCNSEIVKQWWVTTRDQKVCQLNYFAYLKTLFLTHWKYCFLRPYISSNRTRTRLWHCFESLLGSHDSITWPPFHDRFLLFRPMWGKPRILLRILVWGFQVAGLYWIPVFAVFRIP